MSDATTGPTSPSPYSDHGATPQEPAPRPIASGARVTRKTVGSGQHPNGTVVEVIAGRTALVCWDGIASALKMEVPVDELVRVEAADDVAYAERRAAFLRDLTDPAQDAASAPADDRVTDDLRDLIASQSLAMATARTKQGVAAAAVSILAASHGDVLVQAAGRALKTALGGVGDFFDGVDLAAVVRDIATQAGVVLPATAPAPTGEAVAVGVQVDGVTVGTVTVPVFATEEGVIAILRADALLMAKIPAGREVTGVEYVPGKVVRITTAPAESAAAETAPVDESAPRG